MNPLPVARGERTWAHVRAMLRARRGLAALATVTLVAGTSAGLLTPALLGRIVDVVIAQQRAGGDPGDAVTEVGGLAGLLVAVAIVEGVLLAVALRLVARLGEGMLADLRERFVERALHLPLAEVERTGSGDLTARVTNDVAVVAEGVREGFPEFAREAWSSGGRPVG